VRLERAPARPVIGRTHEHLHDGIGDRLLGSRHEDANGHPA
jgi:hypothetical protein